MTESWPSGSDEPSNKDAAPTEGSDATADEPKVRQVGHELVDEDGTVVGVASPDE